MSEELLKANFKVKKPVQENNTVKEKGIKENLREKALASISGSMVYMDRTDLTWDGDK